jgi:putative membrane-bound dehydrogenase-like protein
MSITFRIPWAVAITVAIVGAITLDGSGQFAPTGFAQTATSADDNSWKPLQVPGPVPIAPDDHVAWLRSFVRVPDDFIGEPGGLSAESVTMTLESVTDVAEVFVNGTSIGRCGSPPPDFQPAGDEIFRLKVPPGLLRKGKYNVIAMRLYADQDRAGLFGRAPVITGYHIECVLAGEWQVHSGDLSDTRFAPLDARPPRFWFDQFRPATSVLRPPKQLMPGRHLAPAESLATMKTFDDLAVDLVLAEPEIAQPLSLDFDARGRLWVAEYRQYPFPAGLVMVSRDKFYRAIYDRVPAAPPDHVRGADRISVHEDVDGDGDFDVHKIFVDGLSIATSVEIAGDGVWVLNPPYLLFYPDRDQDDVPDGAPEIHLEGFGLEDTHSVTNSLTYGPDGWLYGAQGSTTSSRVRVRGSDQPEVYRDGAMMWRYHPPTRRYEIFAEGGGNAFGIEIDAHGRLFSGHNGDHTRGFHYVQGGYCQKGTGDKYGPLSNPHAYGHLMYMSHAPTPRFSHDLVKYEGLGLPDQYQGKLFCVDPLHQNVVLVDIVPGGSTFRTRDLGIPLSSSDLAFRPVDITAGPDGALYIADFCEEFIAHGMHYQGQIDQNTGRVYRLRARDARRHAPLPASDMHGAESAELVKRLSHADRTVRRNAARRLVERHDRSMLPDLATMILHATGQAALEALWVTHRLGGLDAALAEKTLAHSNAHVRRWTARLLGDDGNLSPDLTQALIRLAEHEEDPEVRSQLACTAKRLPTSDRLRIVQRLCAYDEDMANPFQPLLVWWSLESAARDSHDVLRLFADAPFWQHELVRHGLLERVMRRYASGGRTDWEVCAQLLRLAPDQPAREKLLSGFQKAFEGRTMEAVPESLVRAIVEAGGASLPLRLRLKEPEAIQEAIGELRSVQGDSQRRLESARLLGEIRATEAVPVLLEVLRGPASVELQLAALTSLQAFDDERIGRTVLDSLPTFPPDVRTSGLNLLASRTPWARQLLDAISAGSVAASAVTPDIVLQMNAHEDRGLRERVRQIWPTFDVANTETRQRTIARAAAALRSGDANPYSGSELFAETCSKCHLLFRRGGNIGPNLTAYRRDDVATMLTHVANPSLEIREGFETWMLVTDDGRIISGFLFDQDANVVVIRGADGQNASVPRANIESMTRQPRSIMPEGILDSLSDQQIRDLFAFLKLSQPLDER